MSNYEQENKINFAFTQNLEHNKMNKISPLFQVNKDKEIEKVSENITERKTAEETNIIINEKKEEQKEPENFDVMKRKIKKKVNFTIIRKGRSRKYELCRKFVTIGKQRKQNGCCLVINRVIKKIHKFVLRRFKHPGLKKLNELNTPQEFKKSYSNIRKLLKRSIYDIYCYYTVPTRVECDQMISNRIEKSEIVEIQRKKNKVLLDELISKNKEAEIFFKTIKVKDFLEPYFFKTKQINSGEIKIKLIGNEFETYDQDFNNLYSPKEKMAIMEELSK